jgi:hypothetical protein
MSPCHRFVIINDYYHNTNHRKGRLIIPSTYGVSPTYLLLLFIAICCPIIVMHIVSYLSLPTHIYLTLVPYPTLMMDITRFHNNGAMPLPYRTYPNITILSNIIIQVSYLSLSHYCHCSTHQPSRHANRRIFFLFQILSHPN